MGAFFKASSTFGRALRASASLTGVRGAKPLRLGGSFGAGAAEAEAEAEALDAGAGGLGLPFLFSFSISSLLTPASSFIFDNSFAFL